MRDIQMVLERWGAWAASDSSGVDYVVQPDGSAGSDDPDTPATFALYLVYPEQIPHR